ncbi:MAG TPA: hypothetical protein EYQ84_03025 [Nitrospinaceae bacterium]|nr:hypothetical protein [Nitrospinaceae bacterium]
MFVYLFFYSTTGSADSPITINTTIDKAKVTTGDIITYTITMKHELDVIPSTPDFNAISKFNIIGYPIGKSKEIKTGVFEQKYSVKLRADQVGTYNISPIRIPFKVKEKNTDKYISGEAHSQNITIEVASVLRLQGEPTDIKDIKDIVAVDRNWVPWFFWGLNIILLTIILYLLWKYRKKNHPNHIQDEIVLSAHEIALRELDKLKNKGLLQSGDAREHFFELSEILRRYLGKRYLFPALDWTTEEITAYFKNQEKIELPSRTEANRILKKSDLIKFAKAKALPETDEIESVRTFIKSTQENLKIGLYSN